MGMNAKGTAVVRTTGAVIGRARRRAAIATSLSPEELSAQQMNVPFVVLPPPSLALQEYNQRRRATRDEPARALAAVEHEVGPLPVQPVLIEPPPPPPPQLAAAAAAAAASDCSSSVEQLEELAGADTAVTSAQEADAVAGVDTAVAVGAVAVDAAVDVTGIQEARVTWVAPGKALGEGTFCLVQRASFQTYLGEEVPCAVKRVHACRVSTRARDLERLVTEVRMLLSLHHENVLHAFGVSVDAAGEPRAVLGLCEGGTLELQLLTGRDWPTGKEQRGWRVARGLACALDHLHTVSGTTKVRAHLHPHTMHAAAHNPRAPA